LLARSGLSTLLLERAFEAGGGARSAELTLPGFMHDVCSTVHPLAFASPFLERLGLERHAMLPVLNLGVLLDLYLGRPGAALVEYERYQQLAGGADAQVAAWITEVRVRAGRERQSAETSP
jgi:phytoene dehydrogenase-like protein